MAALGIDVDEVVARVLASVEVAEARGLPVNDMRSPPVEKKYAPPRWVPWAVAAALAVAVLGVEGAGLVLARDLSRASRPGRAGLGGSADVAATSLPASFGVLNHRAGSSNKIISPAE
jgi:hypothetical protein